MKVNLLKCLVLLGFTISFTIACNHTMAAVFSWGYYPATANNTIEEDSSQLYGRYCNSHYGYCIGYPKQLLTMQPEAAAGDGCVFTHKKDVTVLTVFGRLNSADLSTGKKSLQAQLKEDLREKARGDGHGKCTVTYQHLGKGFYVISGTCNGKIFYQKTIEKPAAFAFAILEYDEAEKSIYDPLVKQIAGSFR